MARVFSTTYERRDSSFTPFAVQAQGALSLGALYERRRAAASAPPERSGSGLELLEPEEQPERHDPSAVTPFDDSARLIRPGSSLTAGGGSPLLSFVPSTRTVYQEEQVSEGAYYDFYRPKAGLNIPLKRWEGCCFPEKLNVALFGTGDLSEFRRPRRRANDLLGEDFLARLAPRASALYRRSGHCHPFVHLREYRGIWGGHLSRVEKRSVSIYI